MTVSFLSLPAELRTVIYELVLPASPRTIDFSYRPVGSKALEGPAISATCKQVCNETLSIHYGTRVFQGNFIYQATEFRGILGPQRASMLRDFRPLRWKGNHWIAESRITETGLSTPNLRCSTSKWDLF